MQECLLVRTLLMVGYTFVKISIIMTIFHCFSPGGRFSLSKQLEAHPRQLGMSKLFQ